MNLKSILTVVFLSLFNFLFAQEISKLKTGDIIFQTSHSKTAAAIELATHSKFSHVGMVLNDNGKLYVLEAVQPVSITPIQEFIERGEKSYYEVKRLKNADEKFTPQLQQQLIKKGKTFKGLNYDFAFSWNDNELYCSELVYKMYKEILNTELAKPKALKTFDLSSKPVQEQLALKYGKNIPYNELMISPQQIYKSPLLVFVK
ncbi:MAG: YiiX family permuted papain-like enzyme [Bacteroidia bacterium]